MSDYIKVYGYRCDECGSKQIRMMGPHDLLVIEVHGYRCDECGSERIRMMGPYDLLVYETATMICRDCGSSGNESTFTPHDDSPLD